MGSGPRDDDRRASPDRAQITGHLGQLRERRSSGLLVDSAGDRDLDAASRAVACSALGLVAELLGRYLFFVTVVPRNMPGSFFTAPSAHH